jgi:hypothetical protein
LEEEKGENYKMKPKMRKFTKKESHFSKIQNVSLPYTRGRVRYLYILAVKR